MNSLYPIHIAFCVNDAYIRYISVCIVSIARCHPTQQVVVHVLSDRLSRVTLKRLDEELSAYPKVCLQLHIVDDKCLQGLDAWSKYTWYRLLLSSVLPSDVHRVLYLDADTLVADDLSPIFEMDMDEVAIAGTIDPMNYEQSTYDRCGYDMHKGYVCAGVLLINLDFWRKSGLDKTAIEWAHAHHDIKYHDQDCINAVCKDVKTILPLRYGIIDALYAKDEVYRECLEQVKDSIERPAIIHYAGCQPWYFDVDEHPMRHMWHRVNALLKYPVRMAYKTKGLMGLKVRAHAWLNKDFSRKKVTLEEIKHRVRSEIGVTSTCHLAFCANRQYLPYLSVALKSISSNYMSLRPLIVHILTDSVEESSRVMVEQIVADVSRLTVQWHEVEDSALDGLPYGRYTKYAWYRMLLPDILVGIDRVLYLDVDVIVDDDISSLFDIDMSDCSIATAPDTDTYLDAPFRRCGYSQDLGYVCDGVMLVNLDYWRNNNIGPKTIAWGRRMADKLKYPDQDSLNYICKDSKRYLPLHFGVTESALREPWFKTYEWRPQYQRAMLRPAIIHYAGTPPWMYECHHPMISAWTFYNSLMPKSVRRRFASKGLLGVKVRIKYLIGKIY